jgi:hypothetical protein
MPHTIRMSQPESERPEEKATDNKKHDPNAETLYGVETPSLPEKPSLEGRVSGIRSTALETSKNQNISHIQEETREKSTFVYQLVGVTALSFAITGTIGYMFATGKFSEKSFDEIAESVSAKAKSSSSSSPAPKSSSNTRLTPEPVETSVIIADTTEIPKEVNSPEDLLKILQGYKMEITPEQILHKSNNLYLEAQRLRVNSIEDDKNGGRKVDFKWETMLPHKGKNKNFTKFFSEGDDHIIVATLNKKPEMGAIMHHGVKPVTTATDEANPNLAYHYYKCVAPKTNNVASISLSSEPDKNIAIYSIQLKQCPVENP